MNSNIVINKTFLAHKAASAKASTCNIEALSDNIKPLRGCLNFASENLEVKWLADNIAKHGQLVPIVRNGKKIVDGIRRLEACKLAGVDPKFVDIKEMGLAGNGALAQEVWDALNGEGRRHLSLNERALIAYRLSSGQKRGSNQHSDAPVSMTQGAASKIACVSPDTIQRLRTVFDKADALGCRVEVENKVRAGESIAQVRRELDARTLFDSIKKAKKKNLEASASLAAMINEGLKFSCVYADPAWDYGHPESTAAGAPHAIYPVMSLDAIKALPVGEISAPDSVCWMWVPNCLLKAGIGVIESWGFNFITTLVWIKNGGPPTKGQVLPRHETLVIGKRGAGLGVDERQKVLSTAYFEPVTHHSCKPSFFAEMIEELYPVKSAKIELFGRDEREGWVVWGNQSDGAAIKDKAAVVAPKSRQKPVVKDVVRQVAAKGKKKAAK
jgi:N6-adenosine-specific RNA methylase IME4